MKYQKNRNRKRTTKETTNQNQNKNQNDKSNTKWKPRINRATKIQFKRLKTEKGAPKTLTKTKQHTN